MIKYLVIDGNFFMHRAMHKMGGLKRGDGTNTGIEYGFIRMLKSTIDEVKPSKTYVVFDGGLSDTRLTILPDYKANRVRKDKIRAHTYVTLFKILESLGTSLFHYDGVEADDVIGLMSGLICDEEELVIASTDTDFYQLIKNNVMLYNPIKKEYMTPPVLPENYVTYKAIIGDVADNIPGLKGIGPKKALKKMNEEWSLEERDIIHRNESIITIPKNINEFGIYYPEVHLDSFRSKFNEWIMNNPKFNSIDFFDICREMEFYSIEANRSMWQNTFGKQISIDDLWK